MEKACWFNDWFNSPYYHLLYNNRNQSEAELFINKLCQHLQIPEKSNIWDLACGKGRHSLELSKKNYRVIGTDLSEKSLEQAKTLQNENLEFLLHDMRKPFKLNYFDYVLNLFTSIGYFDDEKDNFKVFEHVNNALKPQGFFVVDFFNALKISKQLKPEYTEQRSDITFHIHKKILNGSIHKLIKFAHHNKQYAFTETVSLLEQKDFEKFAEAFKFKLIKTFGDYELNAFDKENSDRLILIFKK